MALTVGDQAPDFSLLSDENETIALNDYLGKKVVLYFYPKDDTPGCTREAQGFRDAWPCFAEANTVVLGVSKDSVNKHVKFKGRYSLPFPLLADTGREVCERYGVIVEKSMFGHKYMGIDRATFLIDEQGIIQHIWRKVKVKDHVKEVLATVA